MTDPYLGVIEENWKHIRFMYLEFEDKKPIVLYDVQERRVYVYPYREFVLELGARSQKSLKRQHADAISRGQMVVFVRDNDLKKLVSYTLDIN